MLKFIYYALMLWKLLIFAYVQKIKYNIFKIIIKKYI